MQIPKRKMLIGIILSAVTVSTSLLAGYAQKTESALKLVSAVSPIYPPIAVAANVSGDVNIKASINEQGDVSILSVIDGHPILKDAAKQSAMRWHFAPDAAKRSAILTFTFQIMPRCSPKQEQAPIFYPPLKVEVRAEKLPIICDDCPPSKQEKLRCQNP